MELLTVDSILVSTRSNEILVMQLNDRDYLEPPHKIPKLEHNSCVKVCPPN